MRNRPGGALQLDIQYMMHEACKKENHMFSVVVFSSFLFGALETLL